MAAQVVGAVRVCREPIAQVVYHGLVPLPLAFVHVLGQPRAPERVHNRPHEGELLRKIPQSPRGPEVQVKNHLELGLGPPHRQNRRLLQRRPGLALEDKPGRPILEVTGVSVVAARLPALLLHHVPVGHPLAQVFHQAVLRLVDHLIEEAKVREEQRIGRIGGGERRGAGHTVKIARPGEAGPRGRERIVLPGVHRSRHVPLGERR
mmetsp:Transcript_53912/g.143507  ORF Transcript_53912/g.143507 Transcript_53912/m.143507 type:complete len:206 (+) Transcript_53912:430-1047(+)